VVMSVRKYTKIVLSPIDSTYEYVSFSKDGVPIICKEAESIFGKLLLTNEA